MTKKFAKIVALFEITELIQSQIDQGWSDAVPINEDFTKFSEKQEDIDKVIVEVQKILEKLNKQYAKIR